MRTATLTGLLVLSTVSVFPPAAGADEPQYKRMPWHLVDVWWDTGKDHAFESYAIDVEITGDVPADVRLYVAPVGLGHLSKTPFYGGLQTQSDGNTRADKRLRGIGRGLLMSMWGERSLDAIRPSVGGLLQSSGHEGDFVSVRRSYEWKPGRYTYRIARMDEEVVDGKPYTWVGAFLHAHGPDEHVFIGALRFPGKDLVLARRLANFVEIYGRAIPAEKIPRCTVTFGNLRVNGVPVENATATAFYPKGVPDYADARGEEGRVVVEVGQRVEHAERSARLLTAGKPESKASSDSSIPEN